MKKNIKDIINYSEGGILSKEIIKTKENDVTLFCMAEGTKISDHTSTKEGFVYVVEGNGIFFLGKEEIEMKEGVFIYLKKNIVHSLRVNKNTSFLLVLAN